MDLHDLLGGEFANLPDDDELAFIQLEKQFREQLDMAVERADNASAVTYFIRGYINNVLSVAKGADLNILSNWIDNADQTIYEQNFEQIRYDIQSEVMQIKMRHSRRIKSNSIRLDEEHKSKIRDLITKIKLTIDASGLPVARREKLLDRLNAFGKEVDRERTRLEAYGAFCVEASGYINQSEKKLRPILRWITNIGKSLDEAQKIEEKTPFLPSPRKSITSSGTPSSSAWDKRVDLDDDIPF